MAIHAWPSTDIMSLMPVESSTFILQRQREFSRAASGTVYKKDLGPALWTATVQSVPITHEVAEQVGALIDSAEDQMAPFYVWNPRMSSPQLDRFGVILGSRTPQIAAVNADTKRVQIKGLPVGYTLTRGDRWSTDTVAASKHAMFRVVDALVVADGTGTTPLFEVSPYIRPGLLLAANDPVQLIKPTAIMAIIPGTLSDATTDADSSVISFQTIEVP